MIETKIEEIDGHKYQMTQFPALQAYRIFFHLTKSFGRFGVTILAMIDRGAGFLMELDTQSEEFKELVDSIIKDFDPEQLPSLMLSVLSNTMRDGKMITEHNFDEFYSGNLIEGFKACYHVINFNFAKMLDYPKKKVQEDQE